MKVKDFVLSFFFSQKRFIKKGSFMLNWKEKLKSKKSLCILFVLIFSLIHLQTDLVNADSKISMPFVSSSEIMEGAVADALRALGDENIEIVAQGSWISGKQYRDPRITNILTPSDHDMRIFFRRPPSEQEMLGTWKKFKDQLERELKKWKELGFISAEELEKLRKTINIYPPEELMRGVNNASEAAAKFKQWNIFPGLADTNVEGSFGNMLRFERQGYELGERGTAFFLDKGKVKKGSVDLVHFSEGYGKRTVQNLATAARDKFEAVLDDLAKGDYRSAQKHLKRGRQYYEEARKKARVPNDALDDTFEKLEKRLEELVSEQRKIASGIDAGIVKIQGSDAELKKVNENLAKLNSEIKNVLDEIIAKNTILEAFENALKANQSRQAYFFRKLAQGLGSSFSKAKNATIKALKTIGSEATNAITRLGFMNIIGAYFILNDLPEYYAKGENDKMLAKLGMGIATLAIPGLGEGELIAILAHSIAEAAVNYVSDYGYKVVASTQYCDDLIAGFYSVYGRQTAEEGALRKCHNVKTMRDLACQIPDKEGLTNYLARNDKIDPKLIPSTLLEIVRCHAENASYSGYERRSDKGVEQALFNRCSNALVKEWIEQREASIAHAVGLISQIGRLPLLVYYDPKEAVIKENNKAKIVFNSQINGDLESIRKELDGEYACLGGGGAKFYFSKDYTWKVDGQIITRAGETSLIHEFEKEGTYSVCLELHIRYDFQGGELGRNRPALLDGRMTKTACVDVTVKREPEAVKKVEIIDPNGNTPSKEIEEGKESFFKVKLTGGKPEDLVAVWGFYSAREKKESLWGGKGISLNETHKLLPDSPGEFILRVELYDRMTYYNLKPEKKPPIAQAEINVLVKPSIDRLMEQVKIKVRSSGGKTHITSRGIRQDSDDRTLGVITLGESITLSAEIEAPESIRAYLKEPIWEEFYHIYDPNTEFDVQKKVVGQGNNFIFTPKKYGTFRFGVEVGAKGSKKIAKSDEFHIRVECKKEERGGTTVDVCKTDDADRVEPLEAWLDISNAKPKPGEEVLIKTRVKGGVVPYSFKYNIKDPYGGVHDSDEIIIKADPKVPNIEVEVTDRRGNKAKAKATLNIGGMDLSIEGIDKQLYFGKTIWAKLKGLPNLDNIEVIWITSPEITINQEKNILTFDRLGKVKVFAEVRKKDTKQSIGSSEELFVEVLAPKARLVFEPPTQKTGGDVTATLKLEPTTDLNTLQIRWLSPQTKDREEIEPLQIRFKAKEKPEKIEVLVLGKRGGETIAQLSANYDPTGQTTRVDDIGKEADTAPKIKKLIEDAKARYKDGYIDEAIKIAQQALSIEPKNSEINSLIDKWNRDLQMLNKHVESINKLINQKKFAEAEKELNQAKALHPRYAKVIEAEKRLNEEKNKYQREVTNKINEAKRLLSEKKIDEAVSLIKEVAKIDKNSAQPVMNQISQEAKNIGWDALHHGDYKLAIKRLEQAVELNPNDTDAQKKLKEAKDYQAKMPQIEAKMKEFDQLIAEKKVVSSYQKLLEIQDVLRTTAAGQSSSNPVIIKLNEEYNKLNKWYNELTKKTNEEWTKYFKEQDWELAEKLFTEVLKYEHTETNKRQYESSLQMVRMHLNEKKEAIQYYEQAKANNERGIPSDSKGIDEVIRELNNRANKFKQTEPIYQNIKSLIGDLEKRKRAINAIAYAINFFNSGDMYYRAYQFGNAAKQYEEGLRAIRENGDIKDPLYSKYYKLWEEAIAKDKRFSEIYQYVSAIANTDRQYSEEELNKAIALGEEGLKIVPNSDTLGPALYKVKWKLGELKRQRELQAQCESKWTEGVALYNAQRYSEALVKFKENLNCAPNNQERRNYVAQLEQEVARKQKADELWNQCIALAKQNKITEAVSLCEQSLTYHQREDRQRALMELKAAAKKAEEEAKNREIADRLWSECINLAKANRLNEAVAKCEESLRYHSREDRLKALSNLRAAAMKAQQEAQNKQTADKLWDECISLAKANRLNEAISKCEQSLSYWSSEDRQRAYNQLKSTLQKTNEENQNKQIADKLWNECIELARQKNYEQAWRKCDESLNYWRNDQRIEATAKLKEEARRSANSSIPPNDQTAIFSSSDISGKWSTNWGEMNLTASGDKVSGSYATSNGKIYGTLYNNVLEGYWTQRSSGRRCSTAMYDSYYWGKIKFNFEGNKFRGNWSYCNDNIPSNNNYWTGGRISTVSSVSKPPVTNVKPQVIFNNGNIAGVYNNPTRATTFTINQPYVITLIQNYHWNNSRGSTPGTIGLRDQSGRTYGPWQAKGSPGQGGVPNAYWTVYPNITLSAGTYTVIDSEPSTWAQNSGSGGAGHTRIEGYPAAEIGNQQGTVNVQQGGTVNNVQSGATLNAEITNASRENVHIFVEGQDTFGSHNRVTPGERKTVSIKAPAQAGFINFVAGRNGQVLAKCRWEYVPDYQNRVPVVRFSDPNILSCSTGVR